MGESRQGKPGFGLFATRSRPFHFVAALTVTLGGFCTGAGRPAVFVDPAWGRLRDLIVEMSYAGSHHNFVGRPVDGYLGAALSAHAGRG